MLRFDPGAIRDYGIRLEPRRGEGGKGEKPLNSPAFTSVLITINTNKRFDDEEERLEVATYLQDACRRMSTTQEGLEQVLQFKDADKEGGATGFRDTDRVTEVLQTVEVGAGRHDPTGRDVRGRGTIHAHIKISIKHTTRLFFDRQAIKDFIREEMNGLAGRTILGNRRLPNVKIQLLGDPEEKFKIEKYFEKGTAIEVARETQA